MLCRTDVVRTAHGFNESLRYGEDVDLLWRLEAAGVSCRYMAEEIVNHSPRPTWRSWSSQRVGYGSAAAPLAKRHGDVVAPMAISPWSLVIWSLVILSTRPIGRGPGSGLAMRRGARAGAIGLAASNTATLARKLNPNGPRRSEIPAAARLVIAGHLGAAEQVARALVRPWWPLTVLAALGNRNRSVLRLLITTTVIVSPHLERYRRVRPSMDPLRWTMIGLVDDAAYSAGVWKGALKLRSIRALLPRIAPLKPVAQTGHR